MNEKEEIQDHRDVALETTDDILATRSLSSFLEQSSQDSVKPKRRRGTIASEGMHINLAHLQCMEDVDDVQYHINRRRRHLRSARQQSSRTSSFLQDKVGSIIGYYWEKLRMGQDKAVADIQISHILMLHPSSVLFNMWSILMLFAVFFVGISLPLEVGFGYQDEAVLSMRDITNVLFLVDIIVNCLAGYKQRSGVVCMRQQKVFVHYAKSWLLIDVISTIPVLFVPLADGGVDRGSRGTNQVVTSASLVKFFKILRLLKSARVYKFITSGQGFSKLSSLNLNPSSTRLMRLIVGVLFCAHLAACIWFWVGSLTFDDIGTSWTSEAGLVGSGVPFQEKYITSLYWAVTTITTVGYGDISATNFAEKCFAIFALFAGVILYSLFIGIVQEVLANSYAASKIQREQQEAVHTFLHLAQLPPALRNEVESFYRLHVRELYTSEISKISEGIMQELPASTQRAVTLHLFRFVLKSLPQWKQLLQRPRLPENVRSKLCVALHELRFISWHSNAKITSEEDEVTSVIYIVSGDIHLTNAAGLNMVANRGSVGLLGALLPLEAEEGRIAATCTGKACVAYTLERDTVGEIVAELGLSRNAHTAMMNAFLSSDAQIMQAAEAADTSCMMYVEKNIAAHVQRKENAEASLSDEDNATELLLQKMEDISSRLETLERHLLRA